MIQDHINPTIHKKRIPDPTAAELIVECLCKQHDAEESSHAYHKS